MVHFQEDTVDHMLADAPWEITLGAVTRKCEFREFDDIILDAGGGQAGQKIHQAVVFVKQADYPAAAQGASCVVNGQSFTLRRVRQVEDGALLEFLLRAA